MQIFVLGMHRSGTSVLTRLLNLGGAFLGNENELIRAGPDNVKGFWERKDLVRLNDRVLAAVGLKWDNVSGYGPDLFARPDLERYRQHAWRIMERMEPYRPWAEFKDPRLCLTMPFWRPLLHAPLCIHVFRDPSDSARSLETRDDLPREVGLGLVEVYTRAALQGSAGLPRFGVNHNDLMENPVETMGRVFAWCRQQGAQRLIDPSPDQINAFVDPQLNHGVARAKRSAWPLTPSQQWLVEHTQDGSILSEPALPAPARETLDALAAYDQRCAAQLIPQRWWRLIFRLRKRFSASPRKRAASEEAMPKAVHNRPAASGLERISSGHWPVVRG